MACGLNGLSGLRIDSTGIGANRQPQQSSRSVHLISRGVKTGALATVEIPMLALIGLILSVSVLVSPERLIRGADLEIPFLFVCPFFALTDAPCLFCGMTRSFMAMGGLDIRQAFIYHPLGPIMFVSMLGTGAVLGWSVIGGRQLRLSVDAEMRKVLIRAGAVILIGAWVLKVVIWRQTGLL